MNKDPQGAYDHLQNDGPQGECIRMNGYAHIYTWLWNELSTTDITTIQKGYIQKIAQLVGEYFYRDNRTEHQILIE